MHSKFVSIDGIKRFLLKPFNENIGFFVCLWILASAADVFYNVSFGELLFGGYLGLHGLIQCYFISLFLGLSDNAIWRRLFCSFFVVLGIINLTADVWSYHSLHVGFTDELVAILVGTNISESVNFVKAFFDWKPMFVIIVFSLIALALFFCLQRLKRTKYTYAFSWMLLSLLVFSSILVTVRHSKNWDGLFLNKISLFLSYEKVEHLERYRTNPSLEINGDQPNVIVCFIGESLSKSQCQLWGYRRNTQPNLLAMRDSTNIVLFTDAHSPSQYTTQCFKSLLTTWDPSCEEDWYKCTFLFDVMKSAGYKNIWISNQNRGGASDNLLASMSLLCDEIIWTGEHQYGWGPRDRDEVIIPAIQQVLDERCGNIFVVINIMGSHEEFSERFPAEYGRFHKEDYSEYSENQKEIMANYDNSVLYNDYVVSATLNLFKDREACVIYLPDHGLDLFVSDSTYAGHGRTADQLSYQESTNIPMLVYFTDSFTNKFVKQVNYIESIKDSCYFSSSLPNTVMELSNISLTDQ